MRVLLGKAGQALRKSCTFVGWWGSYLGFCVMASDTAEDLCWICSLVYEDDGRVDSNILN